MPKTIRRAFHVIVPVFLAHAACAQPGTLDSTFADDGVRLFQQSWGLRWYGALALPDGTAILYGEHWITGSHCEACFTHILQDGSTDPDWGTNGYTFIDTGAYAAPSCMLLTSDGGLIAAGKYDDGIWPVDPTGILFRLLPNGDPDPAFGVAGVVVREEFGMINGIRPWVGDRLLMCGGNGSPDPRPWLMRCNADGSLDSTFSADGVVGDTLLSIALWDLAVLDDGSIVGGGSSAFGGPVSQSAFVRVDSSGAPVSSFGDNGVLQGDFISPEGRTYGLQGLGQSFLATGATAISNSSSNAFLVKLEADGTLDPAFNGGSVVIIDRDTLDNTEYVTVDPAGRILVCGVAGQDVDDCRPMVLRYLPTGAVDTTFGAAGMTTVPMIGGYTTAMQMAVQPDERVVVAGYAATTPYGFAFRLEGGGDLATRVPGLALTAVHVHPNPVEDLLRISLPDTWAQVIHVDVIDATGRLSHFTVDRSAPLIEVSALPRGAYSLRLTDGEHHAAVRFIRE